MNTHNDMDIDVSGSSLQGLVHAKYSDMCRVFGEPMDGDGHKVDAEWVVLFDDGVMATIYNWKDGKNYCGEYGMDVKDITEWHVGGHSVMAVAKVAKLVGRSI